ncbi:MAG: hypothetical protein HYS13_08985 [Planctomycetia bacterium]|nr:hypothetical protein [Planctomycetia bacterium]
MSITNYLEEALLKHALGIAQYSPSGEIWAGLCTAVPSEEGTYTEFSASGYSRQPVTLDEADGATIRNGLPVWFGPAPSPSGWSQNLCYALFDASSGGNLLAFSSTLIFAVVSAGKYMQIAERVISVSFSGGDWSTYAMKGLLNLAFYRGSDKDAKKLPYPSAVYAALCTSRPLPSVEDASASNLNEFTGAGYQRVQVTPLATVSQVGDLAQTSNSQQIDYPTAGSNWGSVGGGALCTAQTSGKMIASYGASSGGPINQNDVGRVSANSIVAEIG